MKKSIKFLILAAVLILVIGAYFGVTKYSESAGNEDESTLVAAQVGEDVTGISWEMNGKAFTAVKSGSKWVIDGDRDFPADSDKLTSMVNSVKAVTASRSVNEAPESLSDYGLDSPELTVTLTTAEGDTVMKFGDETADSTGRYFVSSQSKTVFLVDASAASSYFTDDVYNLIDMEEVPDLDSFTKVEIISSDADIVINSDEDGNLTAESDGKTVTVDETKAQEIENAVYSISPEKCVSYKGDKEKYGLDNPQYTIKVTYTAESDGEDAVESVFTANIGSENKDSAYYMNFENGNLIYTISSDTINSLLIKDAGTLAAAED